MSYITRELNAITIPAGCIQLRAVHPLVLGNSSREEECGDEIKIKRERDSARDDKRERETERERETRNEPAAARRWGLPQPWRP